MKKKTSCNEVSVVAVECHILHGQLGTKTETEG